MSIFGAKRKVYLLILVCGIIALILLVLNYLLTGPLTPDFDSVISCFKDKDLLNLIWVTRGPRVVGALLVGASLSVSGLVYQELFGNRMASPDLLGVSQGAAVGASFAIISGLNILMTQIYAFLGGILSVCITYMVSKIFISSNNKISLILAGIIISGLMNSVLGFIKYRANDSDLGTITYWLLGSFSRINEESIIYSLPLIVISIIILCLLKWKIVLLQNGDVDAQIHGVNVKIVKITAIIFSTVATAVSVSMCGIVGFIGLAIPNLVMLISEYDMKMAMPLSIVWGMIFMVFCDLLSRTMANTEIPVGIITSGIGAVMFILIAYFNNKKRKSYDSN